MEPRQRVLKCLRHEEPDMVPVDFWAAPEVTKRLTEYLVLPDEEAVLKRLGADLRYVRGPSYAGQEFKVYNDGTKEFIAGGLDILQFLQPRAEGMGLGELKKEYGKYISFHGSVDIQNTMPNGTAEDVRREVEERMRNGKPGGGFIIGPAHNIQPDTPVENILALYKACKEFGKY